MKDVATLFLLINLASCGKGAKFDPYFYVGDHQTGAIVNRDGKRVESFDPKFDEFACLHKDKIKELKEILIKRCK